MARGRLHFSFDIHVSGMSTMPTHAHMTTLFVTPFFSSITERYHSLTVFKLPELPMLRKKEKGLWVGQDYLRIVSFMVKTIYYWKYSIYPMPLPQGSFQMICEDERMKI